MLRLAHRFRSRLRRITNASVDGGNSAIRAYRNSRSLRSEAPSWELVEKVLPPCEISDSAQNDLKQILLENIVPFWLPGTVDREHGGYCLDTDCSGRFVLGGQKYLISQARMLWFFSRLARSEFGNPTHLEAATTGFRFLLDKMLDREFGGFFWEVDCGGKLSSKHHRVLKEESLGYKSTLAQAYALYAIAEYARASGDGVALHHAQKLFRLLTHTVRDPLHGGCLEFLRRDWSLPSDRVHSFHKDYLPSFKTFGTQAHVLEALIGYCHLEGGDTSRKILNDFADLVAEKMILTPLCVGSAIHSRNWTPLLAHPENVNIYGHDLELIWLLIEAKKTSATLSSDLLVVLQSMFASAVHYGFDELQGGFYFSGSFSRSARVRSKVWWVQAEALLASVYLYRLTKNGAYANSFNRTLSWITNYQVDWNGGEWHEFISRDGRPGGKKSGDWKAAYHTGRSIIETLSLLGQLEAGIDV